MLLNEFTNEQYYKNIADKGLENYNEKYSFNHKNYKLLESIKNYFGPMRERRNEFAKNPEAVMQILQKGGAVALEIATKKMNLVKKQVGLI